MTAMRYREAISIQTRTLTDSPGGQPLESWVTHSTRLASVVQTNAADVVLNDQKNNVEDYTVCIPSDAEVGVLLANAIRIVWESQFGNIILNVMTIDASQIGRGSEIVFRTRREKV